MIVKYKEARVNIGDLSGWVIESNVIKFSKDDQAIVMESPEMARRSMAMIDRHLSRGRSVCNLELLGHYDEKGVVVLVTEVIRRTINRIAGRLGL